MSPQNRMVATHLLKIGALTPMSALVNFGVARLAARIDELHKLGFGCIHTTIKQVNRKRYASYTIDRTCPGCVRKAKEFGILPN
jgi:hypothetical protein